MYSSLKKSAAVLHLTKATKPSALPLLCQACFHPLELDLRNHSTSITSSPPKVMISPANGASRAWAAADLMLFAFNNN